MMSLASLRAALEEDLAWRLDELRHLRNALLSGTSLESWSTTSMRTLLVMQYAHVEGFARNAFSLYVDAVNSCGVPCERVNSYLFAAALGREFEAFRSGASSVVVDDDGTFMRRARNQYLFVTRLRELAQSVYSPDPDMVVSMEMNFGADVFRRTLFQLGIPETEVHRSHYLALEFVRNMRNDIGHGSRQGNIPPSLFDAHRRKCEAFMSELTRLVTDAYSRTLYLEDPGAVVSGGPTDDAPAAPAGSDEGKSDGSPAPPETL